MRISKKLQQSYTLLLVMVILVAAVSSSIIFQRSLDTFVTESRAKEFDQIANEISELSQIQTGRNSAFIENYVRNKTINLTFYNTQNQVVAQFNGIEPSENYDIKLIEKKYTLINRDLDEIQVTGYLKITYAEDIFIYDQSTREFYTETVKNSTILFFIALILASLITIFISKNLTNPIIDIQKKAKQIREKDYNLDNKKYDIYELDELSSDINYLSNTLQLQEKIRLDYATDIAHELRTPITNLMLHLEGIRDDILEADSHTINLLISEVHRINGLIDNLETSFTMTENILELDYEELDLGELLDNIATSFSVSMHEKNLSLNLETVEGTIINSDKNKLTQIITNIISNAIKATDNGGHIEIVQKSYVDREVVRISDNGIGISKSDLEHIFDRFYRVDNVRNTKVSGHGLGLTITKAFVDLLDYNLSVESTEGKGSDFILTISKK